MKDILLATDFSARADRAEARAFERATSLGANLRVVTVVENGPAGGTLAGAVGTEDPAAIAAQLRDMHHPEVKLDVAVERGEAWPAILRHATVPDCALIVLGPADPCGPREKILGSTAERVIHRAPMPVLTVRRRSRGPYGKVVVATDCSSSSRHALLAAAELLPESDLVVLHAYRVPFEGFLSRETNEADVSKDATQSFGTFVESLRSSPGLDGRLHTELLYGTPDEVLARYIDENGVDLVVVGAHGASGTFEKLLGGTAERLLGTLPCDVMVVRKPGGGTAKVRQERTRETVSP